MNGGSPHAVHMTEAIPRDAARSAHAPIRPVWPHRTMAARPTPSSAADSLAQLTASAIAGWPIPDWPSMRVTAPVRPTTSGSAAMSHSPLSIRSR